MDEKERLIAARELISDPAKWTTGYYARTANGQCTNSENPDAVCWCAFGALWKVSNSRSNSANLLETAANHLFHEDVVTVNDVMGHEAILKVYDLAIEYADLPQQDQLNKP